MHKFIIILTLLLLNSCDQFNMNTLGYINTKQGKLHYQSFGKGKPIIVIHGGPGMMDSSYLLPQMLELAITNQVIFYDQRGSGKSLDTPINDDLMNLKQFTEDLEDLRKSLKLHKVILLGHSWGGIIAMNYAINYPENVDKLVLLSTAPADHKGIVEFEKNCEEKNKNIAEEIAPIFSSSTIEKLDIEEIKLLYRKAFVNYVYDPQDAEKISLDFSKESVVSGIKTMEVLTNTTWLNPNFNLLPSIQNIKAPTLIVHGKNDLIAIEDIEKIGEAIASAKIIYVNNCGHFPYIEQPQGTFSVIKEFIAYQKR